MNSTDVRDCIIVGGGIAGLQAAIQLGRYSVHSVAVIDRGTGRSVICRSYHNILGWPTGVSGRQLRELGRAQAESYGVNFIEDDILKANRQDEYFELTGKDGTVYRAKTLLLATGLSDRFPDVPGLLETLSSTVYVCPDCDGYEIQDRKTVVMGTGEPGANMALLLSERTDKLTYVNHEGKPASVELMQRLSERGISYIEERVTEVKCQADGVISSVELANGQSIPTERGFIAFGGNQIHSDLARQLGAELEHNQHVKTDPRSKMTNVNHLWAAGDIGVHSELSTVAMGEGATAAIWINKELRKIADPSGNEH